MGYLHRLAAGLVESARVVPCGVSLRHLALRVKAIMGGIWVSFFLNVKRGA